MYGLEPDSFLDSQIGQLLLLCVVAFIILVSCFVGFIALGAPEPPPAAPAPRLLNSWAELDEMMGNYLREVPHTQAQGHSGVVEGKEGGGVALATNYVLQRCASSSFWLLFFSVLFFILVFGPGNCDFVAALHMRASFSAIAINASRS